MSRKWDLGVIALFLSLFLSGFHAFASENDSDASANDPENDPENDSDATAWFSEFGFSAGAGASFQQKAVGWGWVPGWASGTDVLVGIMRFGRHRTYLVLGYLFYGREEVEGTSQVTVSTSYQRLDFTANYDFCHKALVAGLHLGTTAVLSKTRSVLSDFDVEISGNALVQDNFVIVDEVEARGSHMGFLTGFSVGVDLDPLFKKYRDKARWLNFDLRLVADYLRYGERDDFYSGLTVSYWPFA